jgi:hypothetical protein
MIVSYFAEHPEIVKIFDDLEKFKNYCRFEFLPFNEKMLYNEKSSEWQAFKQGKTNYIPTVRHARKKNNFRNRKVQ